jgi:Flagellar hook-length control protein FliK
MSAYNPLAALAAGQAVTQAQVQAIDLGIQIEILQQQIEVGDLLTATVLTPQGGSDRLALLGQTVLAQLPPGVNPGESLLLQVTGFTGNQILVQNLGTVDPANPPATVQVQIPPPLAPGAPQAVVLTTVVTPNPGEPAAPPAAGASQAPPPAQLPASPAGLVPAAPAGSFPTPPAVAPGGIVPGSVAPSRAVFVAASVQPANLPVNAAIVPPAAATGGSASSTVPSAPASAAAPSPAPSPPVAQTPSASLPQTASAPLPQSVPAPAPPPSAPAPVVQDATAAQQIVAQADAQIAGDIQQLGLEARIAATRAVAIDIADLVTPATPRGIAPGAPPLENQAPWAPPAAPASPPPIVSVRSEAQPPATAPPAAAAAPSSPPVRAAVPVSPEALLLARLGVPVSATTLAAAKTIDTAAAQLPRVLARLDAALAGVTSEDGRVASLRAIAGFVQRLDPGNVRALPEQLAAFVSNLVDSAESKIASLVRAYLGAEDAGADVETAVEPDTDQATGAAPLPLPSQAPVPGAALSSAPAAPAPGGPLPPQAPVAADAAALASPAAAARVAERSIALQFDAKAAIAALAETPPPGAPASLAPALDDALTTITGLQLNVLNAQNADPRNINIPLPVFYHEGGRPVQLWLSRDAPKGGAKLDKDNFHIGFVLDTKSLGTVAIDMQTVGRSVSVNVKTTGPTAADRFRATLGELRERLESMQFRVAAMSADVAAHRPEAIAPAAAPTEAAEPDERPASVFDTRV